MYNRLFAHHEPERFKVIGFWFPSALAASDNHWLLRIKAGYK